MSKIPFLNNQKGGRMDKTKIKTQTIITKKDKNKSFYDADVKIKQKRKTKKYRVRVFSISELFKQAQTTNL